MAHAATCATAVSEPAQSSRATTVRATLCQINAVRRARGLGALRLNHALSRAAQRHSRDMIRKSYFAHITPGGSTFVDRIRRTGYLGPGRSWYLGENLAWGVGSRGTPRGVVRAWMQSAPHRKVLMTPSYREVGIGVVWGAPHRLRLRAGTYTADFGVTH